MVRLRLFDELTITWHSEAISRLLKGAAPLFYVYMEEYMICLSSNRSKVIDCLTASRYSDSLMFDIAQLEVEGFQAEKDNENPMF